MKKNLFASILTYAAPSANYRGESEENRMVLQKITRQGREYAVISPEAIRNALREVLRGYDENLCNRERLNNEEQLAVRFKDYPWPERFIDDFYFGYLVADRKQIPKKVQEERNFQFKRDSVLRNNIALALERYVHDSLFTQSPLTKENPEAKWQNAKTSALLHRETSHTAFQFPIALNLNDCKLDDTQHAVQYQHWFRLLLKAISELNGVAGNAARSYFEMAPASIVIRLTHSLVANYDTYGFDRNGNFPEIIQGIINGDYPGEEFIIGGVLVREVLTEAQRAELENKGVKLFRMAHHALDEVSLQVTGQGLPLDPQATVGVLA